jgi:hypothetical protein
MCAAILSTLGDKFDASAFLVVSSLKEYAECGDDGFQVIVSDEEKLQAQIAACVSFIRHHQVELKRLREAPGIEGVDFRVAYFWDEGVAALAYTLPEELHSSLADIRATLTFCVYPCSKEEPNQSAQTTPGSCAPLRV